jgi:hypothetical protein
MRTSHLQIQTPQPQQSWAVLQRRWFELHQQKEEVGRVIYMNLHNNPASSCNSPLFLDCSQ